MSDDERTVIAPVGAGGGALPVGTGLGEFVIVRFIGEGGFGIVYEAIDRTLQRHVAIKEFMPSSLAARSADGRISVKSPRHRETFDTALRSFVNEARLLAHFDHPALVKVHRFWEANGTAYMVMPLYAGTTLLDTLRQAAAAPTEALLRALLEPLTEALLVLHEQQCYHRDIAPDNILLLAGSGQPLLLDFGAARHVIGDMTQALTVILKPGYAPIEQYAETPGLKQGPWTDVYALAAVIYFAITQRTPPPAVSRLVEDQYEPLARAAAGQYNAAFLAAIDRALAVQPAARTQSVDDLRRELGFAPRQRARDSGWSQFGESTLQGEEPPPAAQGGRSASAPAATETRPPAPQTAPSQRRWWLAALPVLAAAAGGAWYWSRNAPAAPSPGNATAPSPASEAVAAATPVLTPPPAALAEAAASSDAFERLLRYRSPGFDVHASAAKTRLRINRDRLSFKVTSSQSGFVHVLLREPDGTLLLLFPSALSSNNTITAGKPLSLPQATWQLESLEPPGTQRFLVLVSQYAHDFAALSTSVKGDFMQLDERALTGAPGDALPGRAACATPGCNPYGAAAFEVEIAR